MLALKPREASFGMHAERGLPESEQTGSEEQRFAADWLVTIASSHHSRLLVSPSCGLFMRCRPSINVLEFVCLSLCRPFAWRCCRLSMVWEKAC